MTEVSHPTIFQFMPNPPDLIYTAEAAQILGVKVRTVARMAQDGRLTPATPSHGRAALVFHRADVEALRESLQAAS